ncbi:MAG TPA: hypothetical protein VK131_13885, partial [Candidatus Acidoferrales bacterium]|nr:hypothetical protein [Candidatus Acidoferrales bacterium]
ATAAMSNQPPDEPANQVVQDLLVQNRELQVANQRLRLQLEERVAPDPAEDPRVARQEAEIRRLRSEVQAMRAQLEASLAERNALVAAIQRTVDRLSRK